MSIRKAITECKINDMIKYHNHTAQILARNSTILRTQYLLGFYERPFRGAWTNRNQFWGTTKVSKDTPHFHYYYYVDDIEIVSIEAEEKMNVRYIVRRNIPFFNMMLIPPDSMSREMPAEDLAFARIDFEHAKHIYWVDILEAHDSGMVKMRVYMPDGRIASGWQTNEVLDLDFSVNPFKGQFNLRMEEATALFKKRSQRNLLEQ